MIAKALAGMAGIYGLCYLLSVTVLAFSLGRTPVTAASVAYVFGHAATLALLGLGAVVLILACICLIGWAWD